MIKPWGHLGALLSSFHTNWWTQHPLSGAKKMAKSALKVTCYAYFFKFHLPLLCLTNIYCVWHPCGDECPVGTKEWCTCSSSVRVKKWVRPPKKYPKKVSNWIILGPKQGQKGSTHFFKLPLHFDARASNFSPLEPVVTRLF